MSYELAFNAKIHFRDALRDQLGRRKHRSHRRFHPDRRPERCDCGDRQQRRKLRLLVHEHQGVPVQYWNWNSVPLLRLGTVLEQSGTVPGTVPGTVLIEGIVEKKKSLFLNCLKLHKHHTGRSLKGVDDT